ncbi:MAG: protocatechuate 3,4-dioxygenase [Alphaproteobacteria bacterium]
MTKQLDPDNPITGSLIYDMHQSNLGYRLNKLCNSLNSSANREKYKGDEHAYLDAYDLRDETKRLILARDWNGLIEDGANIYFLIKLGFVTGHGLYRMGAQMQGKTYEEFLATRNAEGAR